ncbi:hypothetical protein [Amaricoccus sp.]|uniref:hypothetical protein n=1 Tax=Amaricoccus sp. TaxID=1872485 RepID=UPI001B6D95CD|nr:hypothetical protein [Amaricoccus sp.]MBP7241653.1 hypothetical protein [Amaricoccus sp.]
MKREARSTEDTLAHWVRSAPDKVATFFGNVADFGRPLRPEELAAADRLTTTVLPLGPYRNLTTMTAALFALHPQAVVLNHAADRVFASRYDPFDAPSPERWRAFKAVALRLLRHGRKSSYGGNVLLSHAFRGRPIAAAYAARYGDVLAKPGATTLFWKDSMRFQNRFEAGNPKIDDFIAAVPDAVFIFPVRNPMDCARSNLATGHVRHLVPKDKRNFEATVRRVLEALRWFRVRERADPGRFWSFTEAELGGDFFARFAAFARLPADPGWLADAPGAVEIARRSEHKPGRPEHYAGLVAELFADDPEMHARLERFLA